jgi:hypothetical protein
MGLKRTDKFEISHIRSNTGGDTTLVRFIPIYPSTRITRRTLDFCFERTELTRSGIELWVINLNHVR